MRPLATMQLTVATCSLIDAMLLSFFCNLYLFPLVVLWLAVALGHAVGSATRPPV